MNGAMLFSEPLKAQACLRAFALALLLSEELSHQTAILFSLYSSLLKGSSIRALL